MSAVAHAKRGRANSVSGAESDADTIARSDLDDLLAAQSTKMLESNTALLRAYDKAQQKRFAGIDAGLADVNAKQEKADAEMQKMRASITALEKGLAVAETTVAVRADLDAEDFDREPDVSVLRLGAAELVAKTSLLAALTSWLEDASLKVEDVEIRGPTIGKQFSIKFAGASGLAGRKARKAFGILRTPEGWREMCAAGPNGSEIRLYVSEDKSPKQLRKEILAKKLLRAVQDSVKDKQAHLQRRDCSITLEWKSLVRVEVTTADAEPTLLWNAAAVAQLEVDKECIMEKFRQRSGAAASVQWSV